MTAHAKPGQIVPVDSEHSALAQCLRGGRADEVRRLVLTASGGPVPRPDPRRAARRHARAGAGAPHLVHGAGGHGQLRDAGEQGARGHRGAPAVRDPVRPDRGRRTPHLGGALDGRVPRRLDAGPGVPAVDAHPDLPGAGVAGPGPGRRPRGGLDRSRPPGSSSRSTTTPSRRSAWPARPGSVAARCRPSTTRRTRSASSAFLAGKMRFTEIVPTIARVVAAHHVSSTQTALTVDDVMAADAWARSQAAHRP